MSCHRCSRLFQVVKGNKHTRGLYNHATTEPRSLSSEIAGTVCYVLPFRN